MGDHHHHHHDEGVSRGVVAILMSVLALTFLFAAGAMLAIGAEAGAVKFIFAEGFQFSKVSTDYIVGAGVFAAAGLSSLASSAYFAVTSAEGGSHDVVNGNDTTEHGLMNAKGHTQEQMATGDKTKWQEAVSNENQPTEVKGRG